MAVHKKKNLSLIREIALFNSTTLKPVYNHEKNTLPTKKVIGKLNYFRLMLSKYVNRFFSSEMILVVKIVIYGPELVVSEVLSMI